MRLQLVFAEVFLRSFSGRFPEEEERLLVGRELISKREREKEKKGVASCLYYLIFVLFFVFFF